MSAVLQPAKVQANANSANRAVACNVSFMIPIK